MANGSQKAALLAAKEELLAAYSSVHSSLGRLISLVHSSEPGTIADVLGSESDPHSHSPLNSSSHIAHRHPRSAPDGSLSLNGARHSDLAKPPLSNHLHPHTPIYPAPPQPHPQIATSRPPSHHPPAGGPSFTAVTPSAAHHSASYPHQQPYHLHKPLSKSHARTPTTQAYPPPPNPPLETDDEDDEDDDEDEPTSDDGPHHLRLQHLSYPSQHRPPVMVPIPLGSAANGKKGREKKVKRERDPNAPKRPASAYILFQNAVRQEMRAANPTADYKELARQIGDRWKNLSEDAKRPWSDAGKQAMSSWNIQNKEYKNLHPEATSPHTHSTTSSGGAAPASGAAPRKKRSGSQVGEYDEVGNPLRKKRGRPSKADKVDPVVGRPVELAHNGTEIISSAVAGHSIPNSSGMAGLVTNPITTPKHSNPTTSQTDGAADESEEEEEEDEEEELGDEAHSHPPPPPQPSTIAIHQPPPPPQSVAASQLINKPVAESDDDDVEEEEEEEGEEEEEEESENSGDEGNHERHVHRDVRGEMSAIMA